MISSTFMEMLVPIMYLENIEPHQYCLQSKFCSSPMTSFCVVSDLVPCPHSDPLWDWSVHIHFVCKLTLDNECFV